MITDYIQSGNDYLRKIYGSVYVENVNIGEALVSKVLAKALRHRQDDEQP